MLQYWSTVIVVEFTLQNLEYSVCDTNLDTIISDTLEKSNKQKKLENILDEYKVCKLFNNF
jgi:hypothetical protein